jgi:biopolymer transport protein ExbB/TolQ
MTWAQGSEGEAAKPAAAVADPAAEAAVKAAAEAKAKAAADAKATVDAAKAAAADPAPAPAPAASAKPKKEAAGLMTMMGDGGPMMWVIFCVSLIGLIIFLERGNTLYWAMRLDFKGFMRGVLDHAEGGGAEGYHKALGATRQGSKHPVVKVASEALTRAKTERSRREIETVMEDQMLAALPDLNRRIGLLSFLANSSTLLGLLGTIFGLIAAFAAFGDPNVPAALKQAKLTDGISQAMYTTAAGIVAAVPLLFFHHLLSERQEELMNEMEAGATKLMTTFESNDLFVNASDEA